MVCTFVCLLLYDEIKGFASSKGCFFVLKNNFHYVKQDCEKYITVLSGGGKCMEMRFYNIQRKNTAYSIICINIFCVKGL